MNSCVLYGLAVIGFGVLCSVAICAFIMFKDWLSVEIDIARYNYKVKHRFDKAPTAKCYCKDCIYWNSDNHYCGKFKRYSADSNFCSWADQHKFDPESTGK